MVGGFRELAGLRRSSRMLVGQSRWRVRTYLFWMRMKRIIRARSAVEGVEMRRRAFEEREQGLRRATISQTRRLVLAPHLSPVTQLKGQACALRADTDP